MTCFCAEASEDEAVPFANGAMAQARPSVVRVIMADQLVRSLPHHWEPGWEARGRPFAFAPRGLVCHHTAGAPTGDYGSLRVVRDGRSDLPGPLSQFGLGRSGTIYVIAAGYANHAGGGGWKGLRGNGSVWGIEAENDGRQPWPDIQVKAYLRLAAAICRHGGFSADLVCGHKEWTTAKPDPHTLNMGTFRARVGDLLSGSEPGPIRSMASAAYLVMSE